METLLHHFSNDYMIFFSCDRYDNQMIIPETYIAALI